jgi:hypothetical protein
VIQDGIVRDAEAAAQQYYSHNSPHLLVKGNSCVKSKWVNQQVMDYIWVDDHSDKTFVCKINGISHHCQMRQQVDHGVCVKRTHPGSGRKEK